MVVYDDFVPFVEIRELSPYEIGVRGSVVEIQTKPVKDSAEFLIRKYTKEIMQYIRENSENVDASNLCCVVVFSALGLRRLAIQFTGVNMDRERYEKLETAIICMVALVASEYYSEILKTPWDRKLAQACLDIATNLILEIGEEQPEYLKRSDMMSMQENVRGGDIRLCCWASEVYDPKNMKDAICYETTLNLQWEDLQRDRLDALAGQVKEIIEKQGVQNRVVAVRIPLVELTWLFDFVTRSEGEPVVLQCGDMLKLRFSLAQGLSCAIKVILTDVLDEAYAYMDEVLKEFKEYGIDVSYS